MTCEKNNKGNKSKQWITGLIANTTVLTYGMQSGWTSPSIKILQSSNSPAGYPLSDFEISILASALPVAATFSTFVYPMIADRYGRKSGLILVAIAQSLGWLLKLISANFISLTLSQIFCGIAGAGVFSVAIIYTKEVSDDSVRGAIGSVGLLMQSVGLLLMFAIGAYMDYYTALWIVIWLPILNVFALYKTPESPPFLVKKGKLDEAIKTISYLKGLNEDNKKVISAMNELKNAHAQVEALPKVTFKTMFSDPVNRRAFYLGLFMISVLDIAGNYAIFAYASVILRDSGVTMQAELQALTVPAVMIVGSLLSSLTVEKFGRKPLLITSLVINGIPMLVLGTVLILQRQGHFVSPLIPVICVISSVFAYGSGVLPVPYVVMAEIFNFQIRARVFGIYVTYGWFLCFLQTMGFTAVSQSLGMYTVFYIFGCINILAAFFCILYMPETKGKSLEQIQKELMKEK